MRTCLRRIGILAVAVAVIGITGCPVSVDGSVADGFLEIPGTSIKGNET